MTAKEAINRIIENLPTYKGFLDDITVVTQSLAERDIYYKALCDIESGKDVRMILERVLT